MPDHDDKSDTPQQTTREAAQRGVRLTANMIMDQLAREFDDPEALDEIWDEAFEEFEESVAAVSGDLTVVARLKYLDGQRESIGSLKAEMVMNPDLFRPDASEPDTKSWPPGEIVDCDTISNQRAAPSRPRPDGSPAPEPPPGGVPDQLIDPDVEPVELDPLDAAILADIAHDREVVGRVASELLTGACEGLIGALQRHTDHVPRVLLLCQPPSEDGPLLTPSRLKHLNEYLGPRYRVVEAEPCEHPATMGVDAGESRWCPKCGALHVNGEWRLPGRP